MKVPSKSRLRKQYNNKKKTQTKKQTNQKNPTKQKSAPVTTKFQSTKSTHLLSLLPIHLGGHYNCIGSSIVAAGWIMR